MQTGVRGIHREPLHGDVVRFGVAMEFVQMECEVAERKRFCRECRTHARDLGIGFGDAPKTRQRLDQFDAIGQARGAKLPCTAQIMHGFFVAPVFETEHRETAHGVVKPGIEAERLFVLRGRVGPATGKLQHVAQIAMQRGRAAAERDGPMVERLGREMLARQRGEQAAVLPQLGTFGRGVDGTLKIAARNGALSVSSAKMRERDAVQGVPVARFCRQHLLIGVQRLSHLAFVEILIGKRKRCLRARVVGRNSGRRGAVVLMAHCVFRQRICAMPGWRIEVRGGVKR